MPKRLTTEQFIDKANIIHNNKYDYSLVEYKTTAVKIKIICPKHGLFEQIPNSHLIGKGCHKCSLTYKKDDSKFIEEANIIHNNKYDYSLLNYVNSSTKIKIICPKHGIFEQTPNSHLFGKGCVKCSNNTAFENSFFVERAAKMHNNKYDYSLTNYINAHLKVKIICREHGIFEQIATEHLRGAGCKKCASAKILKSLDQFIDEANIIHNYKFDYSLTEYKNDLTKIKIICPFHGIFEQVANSHLQGAGCAKCSNNARRTTEEFINKATSIHNGKYDYSLIEYKNSRVKLKIKCPSHGIFLQIAPAHLAGQGCPKCINLISSVEMEWLDQIGIKECNRQYPIIIYGKKIKADGYCQETNTIYEFYGDFWHGNPETYNANDINPINQRTFGELYEKTIKREAAIIAAGYNLITIWEHDFNKLTKSAAA